ncbi:DUF4865 family protein [Streptomyces albireticuli]|uniref:DUF4865 domain-containing protein n=1 Tax=Streptomyces albireticuli TaxID=1940 RepID=A0A2A2CXX9_9ACTN|nr:DUF4865 family protein [Streptomyces albireticuli]MCD9141174.1 DUF4865 family protein [Streptomyces albireticuli]MCD9160865.1 DUF4865 family protein [Streptomyces albireticuli]MCD9191078.1 DUF4865 family protein [Streptomyces albireticuli]PAU44094.1 DUF4865 domain-containing protein [Streptomyces albireticuli]
MYAMQYEITLPADYDMGIIRDRVATRGHLLDDLPGLGLKAYVIRERGVDGSPVNQYAPVYLWRDTDAMSHFLVGGGGFQGIIGDFGRPAVQHWTGLATLAGPARGRTPAAASRRLTPIPPGAEPGDLAALIQEETRLLRGLAAREGVHTAALAVDPRHWQLMRLTLWERTAPRDEDATERYEVLHLSAPHLDESGGAPRR